MSDKSSISSRPKIHFTANRGWINDPLGLTYHRDQYHLFYQCVPTSLEWRPQQNWGHAVSRDGLHWSEREIALRPGDGDDGVWSGSLISDSSGEATIFYTSIVTSNPAIGRIRVAHNTDPMWDKWSKDGVVACLPEGQEVLAFRDPYVFRDGGRWRMVVGTGTLGGMAEVLGWVSDDFETWNYTGPVASRPDTSMEPVWTGKVWECPQFISVGDHWVLSVSVWEPDHPHYEACAIGQFVGDRFEAHSWQRLTYGPSYYAGSAWYDEHGNPGLIYWLRGIRSQNADWASALSVPHMIEMRGDRVVAAPPSSVLEQRFPIANVLPSSAVAASDAVVIPDGTVGILEWRADKGAVVELSSPAPGTGDVRASAPDEDGSVARIAVGDDALVVTIAGESWQMPVTKGGSVRALVDGPVLEVFGTDGVLAAPLPQGHRGAIRVKAAGGGVQVFGLV